MFAIFAQGADHFDSILASLARPMEVVEEMSGRVCCVQRTGRRAYGGGRQASAHALPAGLELSHKSTTKEPNSQNQPENCDDMLFLDSAPTLFLIGSAMTIVVAKQQFALFRVRR